MHVPLGLQRLRESQDGATWLTGLPSLIDACRRRWGLRLGIPYEDSYVSWVSRAWLPTGEPTILKIQFPHEESRHEGEALLRWGGDGAVRLVDHDPEHHALLIEPCVPGHHLSTIDPGAAIEVMTGLLPRLWIPAGPPFRSLADEAAGWVADLPGLWDGAGRPFEESLLDEATTSLTGLATSQGDQVLIHQDLHGDNVLAASREPWLCRRPQAARRRAGVLTRTDHPLPRVRPRTGGRPGAPRRTRDDPRPGPGAGTPVDPRTDPGVGVRRRFRGTPPPRNGPLAGGRVTRRTSGTRRGPRTAVASDRSRRRRRPTPPAGGSRRRWSSTSH